MATRLGLHHARFDDPSVIMAYAPSLIYYGMISGVFIMRGVERLHYQGEGRTGGWVEGVGQRRFPTSGSPSTASIGMLPETQHEG